MGQNTQRLRMLVPRVYGLGDLSQILDERASAQAIEILSALGDDLSKFVITDAYRRSARALLDHGFVLLLGEPASGKSTIAATLAVGALDECGCYTIKVRDADEFVAHSNPHEPNQFFWVDDAFGATQIDWQETIRWNKVFPHLQAAIRRGAKVVFTSRDYIYKAAKAMLKQSALPLIQESQVVIHVEEMSKDEKEQILYNHIRLGRQPPEFKSSVKPFLPIVASHQRFSPEIARRLGNPAFTRKMAVSGGALEQFVSRPMELLKEIILTLDSNSRAAIALVFMRGGVLPSPMDLTSEEHRAVELLGAAVPAVRNALGALEGSLLVQVKEGGNYAWQFKHPTIRDAFADLVSQDRELMDIYLRGTPVQQLFREVSCGSLGIAGVKVVVPESRYNLLISRIDQLLADTRERRDAIHQFLAHRCDKNFLSIFISRNVAFIGSLRVYSYLSAVSDVGVLVRLHEFGLLPEEDRERTATKIAELAVSIPDADFLRKDIRSLLTKAELEEILEQVRSDLIPDLSSRINDWKADHDGEEDPESYFDLLVSTLQDYRTALADDVDCVQDIDHALDDIRQAIEDLQSGLPGEPDIPYERESRSHATVPTEGRSIFDDVDT